MSSEQQIGNSELTATSFVFYIIMLHKPIFSLTLMCIIKPELLHLIILTL